MDWITIFWVALGGYMFVEGVLFAIFPSGVRNMYEEMLAIADDKMLHYAGLLSVAIGVVMIMLAVR